MPMSILPITFKDEAVLHQPTGLVKLDQLPQYQALIDSMIETMHQRNGIGIAANQVSQSLQIAIINHEAFVDTDLEGQPDLAIINPSLTASKKSKLWEEGCLSVPGTYGRVPRAERVRVKAWDRHGKKMDIKAKGLLAHVLQHEIDHLRGVVFVEKAERTYQVDTHHM